MIFPEFARKDFKRLITLSVPLTAVIYIISLLLIGFDLYFLFGMAVGFVLMLLNFYLTALFLSSVSFDKEKATSKVVTSYVLRYILIGLVFTGAVFISVTSAFGVALELLFPKLIFTVFGIIKKGE